MLWEPTSGLRRRFRVPEHDGRSGEGVGHCAVRRACWRQDLVDQRSPSDILPVQPRRFRPSGFFYPAAEGLASEGPGLCGWIQLVLRGPQGPAGVKVAGPRCGLTPSSSKRCHRCHQVFHRAREGQSGCHGPRQAEALPRRPRHSAIGNGPLRSIPDPPCRDAARRAGVWAETHRTSPQDGREGFRCEPRHPLLLDGFDGLYEAAVVISDDSDLEAPIREANRRFGSVHVVSPRGPTSTPAGPKAPYEMSHAGSSWTPLDPALLSAAQLPSPLRLRSGRSIHRPPTWT
jgi:hypothetical protein